MLPTKLMPVHFQNVFFDELSQQDGHLFSQFNKTVIGYDLGKEMTHILTDLFLIEMLQTTIYRVMEKYQDDHHFCLGHCRITMILSFLSILKRVFCYHSVEICRNHLPQSIANTFLSISNSPRVP